jgi:hypothetical protein
MRCGIVWRSGLCFMPGNRISSLLCTLLASVLAVGCGGDSGPKLDRQAVKGTVTREGIPIDLGSVQFEPTGGGPAVGGQITDGKYEISKDAGPIPGSYKVTIVHPPKRIEQEGVPRKEWEVVEDTRFKGKQPQAGWVLTATVSKDQSEPLDFKVGE